MENGAEPNKNDAADSRGLKNGEEESGASAGHVQDQAIPESAITRLQLEIGRLQQENEYLRTKVNDLEADKIYLMEQAKTRDQLLVQTNALLKNVSGLHEQARKNSELAGQPRLESPDEEIVDAKTSDADVNDRSKVPEPTENIDSLESKSTSQHREGIKATGTTQYREGRKATGSSQQKEVSEAKAQLMSSIKQIQKNSAIATSAIGEPGIEPPIHIWLTENILGFFDFHFLFFRRLFVTVVFASLVVFVYIFFVADRSKGNVEPTVESDQRQQNLESTDNIPSSGRVSYLISQSKSFLDETSLPIPVRLAYAKKRIQFADLLLEIEQDREAQGFGTYSKIQALTRLELLNLENDQTDLENRRILREMVDSNIRSTDAKIANSARAAKALHSVLDYLDISANKETTDPDRKNQLVKAIKDFETASEFSSDDFSNVRPLFEIATFMNDKKNPAKIPELLDLFRNNFSTSNNESIRSLATEANNLYLNAQHPLTNVVDGVEDEVEQLISDLSGQIGALLALPNIEAGQFARISNRIAGVAQVGRFDEARTLMQKTLERIGSTEELRPIRNELEIMMARTALVGQPFSTNGITELDGTPAIFHPDAKVKLILFVSNPTYRQCVKRLNSLCTVIDNLLAQTEVSIAIVFKDDVSKPDKLAKLNELKRMRNLLDVWKIDLKSDEGQEFVDRFPISQTPFLIILNDQDELIAIDPPEHVLLSVVLETLATNYTDY